MGPSPADPHADALALLERVLTLRQEALLTVERLLAGPVAPNPAALAVARRRVEGLALASSAALARLEAAADRSHSDSRAA